MGDLQTILTSWFASDTVAVAMSNQQQLYFLACIFLFVEPLGAFDAAGQPSRGVLVLRNGEVLSGITSKVGDRYVVARSDGTELRIPTREVEMHCLDLEEAYLRRRQTVSRRDASAVLQLAEWCLRCGLHARAADELLIAFALAPRDPRIKSLERRLQAATTPEPIRQTPLVTAPAAPRSLFVERLPPSLPAEVTENFTSRIQPLLLNRCGNATCHGERSSSTFQLFSPGVGKNATLRHTQHNLTAVVQQLHSDKPADSPLLIVPQGPHGGCSASVFSERDRAQLELLKRWVLMASRATAEDPLVANGSSQDQIPRDGTAQPVSSPGAAIPTTTAALSGNQHLPQNKAPEHETAATIDFQDPFDPERFNRRFLPAADDEPPLSATRYPEKSAAAEQTP